MKDYRRYGGSYGGIPRWSDRVVTTKEADRYFNSIGGLLVSSYVRGYTDVMTTVTPGVNVIIPAYEAFSGKNIYGDNLSGTQRVLAGGIASIPVLSKVVSRVAPVLRSAAKGEAIAGELEASFESLRTARTEAELARAAGRFNKASQDAASLLRVTRTEGPSAGVAARVGRATQEAAGALNVIPSRSCFVAGTPLLTPSGSKPIEEFRVGDEILSRSEHDPEGFVLVQRVERVFIRVARVLALRVRGREIRTTWEHPFYALGKGWISASEIRPGDKLLSHDGQWIGVDAITDLKEFATVYNLRVSSCHTYFVGARDWGFSVWAHNAEYLVVRIEGTQAWTIVNEAGEIVPVAAGRRFGNPTNAARFAEGAGIEGVTVNRTATWSAERGLQGVAVRQAGAEVRVGAFHTDRITTPQGPVEVNIYAGAYDPGSRRLGLARHHQAGAEVLSGNAQVAIEGNWPGVTVYDFPSQNTLIWNNVSGALPTPLTNAERSAIQRGLESAFPGRRVVFDREGTVLTNYRAELMRGGS